MGPGDGRAALKILIEIIGWTAAAMMLSAYMLLTSGRLSSSSGVYQWAQRALRRGLHHQQRLERRLLPALKPRNLLRPH